MAMVSTLQPPSASRSSEKKNRRGLYNAEYHAECCTKYLRSAINGSDGRHTILYDLPSCGTGFSHASETATEISLYCTLYTSQSATVQRHTNTTSTCSIIYSYGVDICSFVGALHHNTIRASPTIAPKSQSSYSFWGLVILYSPNNTSNSSRSLRI